MRMWSLQNLLFTLSIPLSCVTSAAGLIHVSGYEGGEVNVSCPYGVGYESYEKYLCRNDCGYEDVLIMTTEAKKSKYSIHDARQSRVFTTTISDLTGADAGKYWCGVTRNGKDIYTEVRLDVGQDTCCDQSTKVQSYEEGSVSFSCSYESEDQNKLKYVCRGKQTSTCLQRAVITSDSQPNGQFRLTDDKTSRKFTVTISRLTKKDSGLYLCGVQHSGLDVFSAIDLEVKEWCCVRSNRLSGIVGRPVTMKCAYPPQHRNNRKFLCKGDHRDNCADIVRSQSRFTLQDDISFSFFLVTITELEAGDAGTYWCGSDSQWSPGNYTKIQLSVDAALFYPVVFTVPAVLLILTSALVIVYKYKCRKAQGARANMNRNQSKAAEAEEVTSVEDDYENQEVVVRSRQQASKLQRTSDHCDDAGKDEQDSVYQNFTTTEEIYCNQMYITAKR
ncbi:CMRF35-like molecule 1 isoform X2 [Chelmon rostratus]|uniref:CMRF35-like molecule 1 isoform X2 n=1 Tax=Chelmon rostratus TaxID=109905 RepID=UPI001BE749AE|nr:CMRF35-like molecule 1 isoform X2 [Chelmon rostratus]